MTWTDEMIARLLALRAKGFGPKACAWWLGVPEKQVKYKIRRMNLPPIRSPFPHPVRDHRAEHRRRVELAAARKLIAGLTRDEAAVIWPEKFKRWLAARREVASL